MKISMSSPDVTERERQAVQVVLENAQLSLGPRLDAFEKEFAQYIGAQHGIGVSSGTAGLHLCVIASGCQPGDIIVTTPFSFVASANVILYERCIPLFVDVDEKTGNIDPRLVAQAIDDVARNSAGSSLLPPSIRNSKDGCTGNVRAILPVHAFGQPADMDPLIGAAHKGGAIVIEDACEAIGARYKDRQVGTSGTASVFAFYPNKQMTTGEGGMVVTNNGEWAELLRSLRNQGRDVFDSWLNHSRLGYNYRMDEMSAALGYAQLERISELLVKRERVANWYNERLSEVEGLTLPRISPTTTQMSWFVYVVRLTSREQRMHFMKSLAQKGIPSRPYFSPIHLQPFYAARFGYERGNFPIAERLGDISLALPFSGVMSEAEVDYVCDGVRGALVKSSGPT